MAIRRIGVLTSGGDAPGMNAAVRSVVRAARFHGVEVYGIRRCWNGLINGDIERLDEKSVTRIINKGGTILYSARSKEFKTEEGMIKAVETCLRNGIEGMVCIGGDGTFRGATDLTRRGIPCIGIPATIDNDIASTEYRELDEGQVLAIRMNDGEPVQNVPRSVKDDGHKILKLQDNGDETYTLYVEKVGE